MRLSIIVPAWNEARKISHDVTAAAEFLQTYSPLGELIVVDDGSTDETTRTVHESPVPKGVRLTLIRHPYRRGKGAAVRSAVLASDGEFVLFADSGLTVPFQDVLRGIALLRNGDCEAAHGSRKLPGSVIRKKQDWDRRVVSALFRRLASWITPFASPLTDTQCGFKVYRGDIARELYQESSIDGFMFDIEIILRAEAHGYRILEFPIEWRCDRDSRLSLVNSPWPILRDLLRIRRAVPRAPSRN